jgi:citrate lyase beta subunit
MTDPTARIALSIPDAERRRVLSALAPAQRAFALAHPGPAASRQPVHTLYGGADRFRADRTARLGDLARRTFHEHAPDFASFARVLELPGHSGLPRAAAAVQALGRRLAHLSPAARRAHPAGLAYEVHARVGAKLEREPVEDFRIDFEDGFGSRSWAEEDAAAAGAAAEVAAGLRAGSLPPFLGIRIKALTPDLQSRAIRTLDLFVSTLARASGGRLPDGFVVVLPKVTHPAQVAALARLLSVLEPRVGVAPGRLRIELMVETPQALLAAEGRVPLRDLVAAGDGRVAAVALGTYDLTAACDIAARDQAMGHPLADFALQLMQLALAGTGVRLSDGATQVLPVGPHRAPRLTPRQRRDNREAVHHGWRLAYAHTRHSLRLGIHQGWDLHPAQLPVRYAAVYTHFLEGLDAATVRLRGLVDAAAHATLTGTVFDDAASGLGLLNHFVRALQCGACTEEDVRAAGLTPDSLRSRSFAAIVAARREAGPPPGQ